RCVLPLLGARRLQAAAPLCLCRRNPEIAGRQAAAKEACRRRIYARNLPHRRNATSARSYRMSVFSDPRLQKLDGFRVEIDPVRERADIVLDRPPLNVIEMGE